MDDDSNLALDIELPRDRPTELVAAVYLSTVCSYLKASGAPTLTTYCGSFSEFEREVTRLKAECDSLLQEAGERFASVGDQAAEENRAMRAREPIKAPASTAKTLLKLDQQLRVEDRMTRDVRTLHRK